jgi:IS5 family transposase
MRQAKARIFRGETRSEGKIVSIFEPSTEVIRKSKAAKPTEFGKLVKLQEAENQIVIDYEVYAQRPNDSDLLIPAIEMHATMLGRVPHLLAADAGFYSDKNESRHRPEASNEFASPIAPPKAATAGANRRSAGSAAAGDGAPGAKVASA